MGAGPGHAALLGPQGERRYVWRGAPASVSFIHGHEATPPPLKPAASLSRQPPPSRSTFSGAQATRARRGPRSAACEGLSGRGVLQGSGSSRASSPLEPSQGNAGSRAKPRLLSPNHIAMIRGERPTFLRGLSTHSRYRISSSAIFKARRWGQLEPVALSQPNASSFFQLEPSCLGTGRAQDTARPNEALAPRAAQQLPQGEQAESLGSECGFLARKRGLPEIPAPESPEGWVSGPRPGSLLPGPNVRPSPERR